MRARGSVGARTPIKGPRRTRERLKEGTIVGSLPNRYHGTNVEKAGKIAGTIFQRGGRSDNFVYLVISFSPTCPRGDMGHRQVGSRGGWLERQRPWDGAYEMRRRNG
jgi:hypothetical protein